ncbi:cation-translocating P-type ATPase [Candidatus Nitrospira bockiana]
MNQAPDPTEPERARLPWHAQPGETLARELGADVETGLSEEEARRRLIEHGPNELPAAPPASPLALFLEQFSSVIIWVLIGAAAVSGLLGEWIDAGAILAIVVLNAVLGFVQEFRAERSLEALKKMAVVMAHVVRAGELRAVPARELVPGDLIQIEAGDRIAADARVIYATAFQTQEAALTGESTPVSKSIEPILQPDIPLGDRRNMVYSGTIAVSGRARAIVIGTGLHTELGKIAALIQTAAQRARMDTPLQRRLEQLGHTLLWLSLGIVTVVFLLGAFRGVPLGSMFLTAVSLAVAAIPEGLPAVVTITLALGVTRMVHRHALIRRLPAVETLGSTTVICSDKTGTLTKNEMTVTALYQDGEVVEVSGEGYAPVGEFSSGGRRLAPDERPGLTALLHAAVLCNGAALRQEGEKWSVVGDPTEGALLVAAQKAGVVKTALEREAPLLGEAPFDPERKKMTIVRRTTAGPVAFVKGAPDVLLRNCATEMTRDGTVRPLTKGQREAILAANGRFAAQALRVLGVAMRRLEHEPARYGAEELERDLTFLGLMAMKDPIRPEAKAAVEACRTAGIRTIMITGDHKDTAVAIARELGLLDDGAEGISGAELNALSDEELVKRVPRIGVYARVSAEHKLRVVRAWKRHGAVVAMTGDGVNDAPAVKEADIGVAMGITGTDVTKEASDMVVTDDNFASISAAVEEGRAIFQNIRKAVHYLLSCNISEILVMLFATLMALPLPLLPVQILWINLVTDSLPALALAMDPKAPDLMRHPPRPVNSRLLDRDRIFLMFVQGLFLAVVTILGFVYCLYSMDNDLGRARTAAFTVLVIAQLAHAFNIRSDRESLFTIGPFTNRYLVGATALAAGLQVAIILFPPAHEIFKVAPFDFEHWLLFFGLAAVLPVVAMELWKAARRAASNEAG